MAQKGATIYYFYLSGGVYVVKHPFNYKREDVKGLSWNLLRQLEKEEKIEMIGKEKYQSYTLKK